MPWIDDFAVGGMLAAVAGIMVFISAFPFYWMFVVASNDTSAINNVPPAFLPFLQVVRALRTMMTR